MDHEATSVLLSDWVTQRLSGNIAAEVAAHVENCTECRGIAESLVAVRGEVAEHGDTLWSPHPSSDDLAHFVSGGAALHTDVLARLGAHVHACPTCALEARLGRDAQTPSAWRSLRAWLPGASDRRAMTAVALGALAVVLAYPAYVGLVEYPRERMHTLDLERRARRTQFELAPAAAPVEVEGPAAVLVLEGASRGSREVVPSITLRSGQVALPVLIDAAPPSSDPVELVLRDASGKARWRMTARGADLWDPNQHVLSLLIPVSALTAGEFGLSIGASVAPAQRVYPFRVNGSAVRLPAPETARAR